MGDKLDAQGGLSTQGECPRDGAITALLQLDSQLFVLAAGHVTLPISGQRIRRSFPPPPQDSVLASATASWVLLTLDSGRVDRQVDYSLLSANGAPHLQVNVIHPASGSSPPFPVRSPPLMAGEFVYQWSRMRNELVAGTLAASRKTSVTLRLPDGTSNTYLDVLVVESGGAQSFSIPGDSGSLVIDEQRLVVGTCLGNSHDGLSSYVLPIDCLRTVLGSRFSEFFSP